MESQQLLVNSKLKKIENISDEESKAENEEEMETENNNININGSKDQINNITDKSKISKTPSSASSNNPLLSLSNFDNLKQKIDNTLKRVNQVFSKENFKKLKDTSNTNSKSNNEEYETSNNLNSHSNINKSKEKEKIETTSSKNKSGKKSSTFQDNNIKDLKVKTHELNIDTTNVNNKERKNYGSRTNI